MCDWHPDMPEVRTVALKACFSDPLLGVMNFLNEVVSEFPGAISLAPGRPLESLFHVHEHLPAITAFVEDAAVRRHVSPTTIWRDLGQYGRTNGIIHDVVARHLAIDERIIADPTSIIVTVGAQEAMAIVLTGLFESPDDILLVTDPTYIGITGLARILGIRVLPVACGERGLDPDAVEHAIVRGSREGRVRALYDIPDFNNPLGSCLPLDDRLALLEVCDRHGVLVIEDNPYGMFAYDHPRLPTLKALDRAGNVLYIGSFAKTMFPGLRLGYLLADQRTTSGEPLASALSRVKSLLTVNTSPLVQAVAGGMLLRTGGSLEPMVAPKREAYRQQRNTMLSALHDHFVNDAVAWNSPAGGFFLTVTLPFEFGPAELRHCASEYGVIVSPMRFFCLGNSGRSQIRLSFSYVDPRTIAAGVERLAHFVRDRIATGQCGCVVRTPKSPVN
jgi:(S)-3,5-dihydroxyphenylglycine transaminase